MEKQPTIDRQFLASVRGIIMENIDNEHFSVDDLAKAVGYSRSALHRKLIKYTGKSATDFITELRLSHAKELLQQDAATASEIAYMVGFSSPSYFHKVFKKYCGLSPGEFRKSAGDQGHDQATRVDNFKIIRYRRLGIFAVLFLAVLILLIVGKYYVTKKPGNQEKSIAILPFDNLSNSDENRYFADGLAEDLISYLSIIPNLKVISRTSSEMFREKGDKTVPEIAKILGVNYILEGTVQRDANLVKISIQLIDGHTDDHLLSKQYNRKLDEVFEVQAEIAEEITSELSLVLSDQQLAYMEKKPTDNLEAYNLYLKGRFFWHRRTEEDLKKSTLYFNQSIELDSSYALAYTGLADAYFILSWYGWYPKFEGFTKGKELALKALSINNNISEAHAILGGIGTWFEWNWINAENEIKLAIALNPNNASALQYYSELLDILGKDIEARNQIDHAKKLNPNSWVMNDLSGMYYYHNTEFNKAIKESMKALEFGTYNRTMLRIFKSYVKLGLHQESVEYLKTIVAFADATDNYELLDDIYQQTGIEGIIIWLIDWILCNERQDKYDIPSPNYQIASLFAMMGDSHKCIEFLEKGMKAGEVNMPRINTNQDFDFIRNDPKFSSLLKKMDF